jgi:hypothetical protein
VTIPDVPFSTRTPHRSVSIRVPVFDAAAPSQSVDTRLGKLERLDANPLAVNLVGSSCCRSRFATVWEGGRYVPT